MAITLGGYSELMSVIYDAALDASGWEPALDRLVAAFGGNIGALLIAEPTQRRIISTTFDSGSTAVKNYNEYYGRLDPIAAAFERAPTGAVFSGWDIIPPEQQRRSEFFNDWAHTVETGDGVFANLIRNGDCVSWLCIAAPVRPDSFGNGERRELMRLLVPHLQQAIRTQMRLEELTCVRDRLLDAWEHVRHGIVLAGPDGKILYANLAATAIFDRSEGLTLHAHGQLRAALAGEDAALLRLIGVAGRKSNGHIRSGGSLAISRPAGRRPLLVHVLPLGPDAQGINFSGPASLIVIVDVERQMNPPSEVLLRLYSLTKAETAVAIATLHCDGLQSVADELSVSLSTVRIHLQRVFDKVGVHRQAELVRLLLKIDGGFG